MEVMIDGSDWTEYYKRARRDITFNIEDNWDRWTSNKYRYLLISQHCVVEDDISKNTGSVTGRIQFCVTSDNIDYLLQLWKTPMFQHGYDSTVCHFIVDTKERKVMHLLSICA